MWGLQDVVGHGAEVVRFIPTHVGVTKRLAAIRYLASVHPHSCGGYVKRLAEENGQYGSSPLMWGLHLLAAFYVLARRFIPTHVGVTTR